MKKSPDSGITPNIANFETLLSRCVGLGIKYKPKKESIQLPAMATLLEVALKAQEAVKDAESNFNFTINERRVAFAPVKELSTCILNAYISCDALPENVDDLRGIVNKIRGSSSKSEDKPNPESTEPDQEPAATRSTSFQSMDYMIEHYKGVLSLLKLEAKYEPNEENLTREAITALIADLKAKNTAAIDSYTRLNNARIERDKVLYAPKTGLVATAAAVKKYVKSACKVNSTQFKSISPLSFKGKKIEES